MHRKIDEILSPVRIDEWRRRVRDLRTTAVRLQTQRDTLVGEHQRATGEVARLGALIEKLTKTGELLRALMDKLVTDQVKAIESVVTEGFKSIFYDQHLSLVADVGQARGKVSIDLLIKDIVGGDEIIGPPLETFGGGPSTIASLTLRILALMRLKKFPMLLLDETLAAISAEYVDPTGKFLSKLAESTGIPILLVTHNHAFLDHAKVAYRVDGEQTETSKTIRITKIAGGR